MLPRSQAPRNAAQSDTAVPRARSPRPAPHRVHSGPPHVAADASDAAGLALRPRRGRAASSASTTDCASASASASLSASATPYADTPSLDPSASTASTRQLVTPLPRRPGTASSSTTSIAALGAFSGGLGMTVTGAGAGAVSTAASAAATPQTGASKMAAAAAAKKREGVDGVGRELRWNDDEHPLSDKSLEARDYHTVHTMSHLFHLPRRWRLLRPLGQGAYGLVVSVQDELSGEPVAVKCITRVFDKAILARRALREITLLRHFGDHENLTGLIDLDHVWDGYNEIYLYMEPMEADLHQIVRSGQPLSGSHVQFFLYQLLRGMKYIHSANVIHRDLKPGNLLVNSDCELKICDFGLARGFRPDPGPDDPRLTEYVATRWYRAPEVMLSNRHYTTAIDVWSIGCILAELLSGKPLFKGKDYVDQLNLILGILGTPDDETLERVGSSKACQYLRTLPYCSRMSFAEIIPEAPADAVDLLDQLLAFDPSARTTVPEALQHAYVATYHDPTDEPDCFAVFDKWTEVEALETVDELRDAISREIREFRAEVRDIAYSDDEDAPLGAAADVAASALDASLDHERERELEPADPFGTVLTAAPQPHVDAGAGTVPPHAAPHPALQGSAIDTPGTTPGTTPGVSPSSGPVQLPSRPRRESGRSMTGFGRVGLGMTAAAAGAGAGADAHGLGVSPAASPRTPATALSEESFGHSAPASRRHSRRTSAHSLHRRPTSFLFGAGMTPMTALGAGSGTGTGAGMGISGLASMGMPGAEVNGTASDAGATPDSRRGSRDAGEPHAHSHAHHAHAHAGPPSSLGRRSRAPSSTGIDGSLRPLIRRLSTVNLADLVGAANEVPPMTVSPSDAPASEVPKSFGVAS
ncbi:hypothetical protein Q5752_006841 [Cryptotrichosporon argae]